jgi:hypothetical protein
MTQKLSADQMRRIETLQEFHRTAVRVKKLVTELDANRAAKEALISTMCETIAREMAQFRQRLLTANVGTIADVAGAMSVMAGRTGSLDTKIRGLLDGANSLNAQLEQALQRATHPESRDQSSTPPA